MKPSDARARIVRHMAQLAAGTVAAGAMSCDDHYGVVDPVVAPARCKGAAGVITAKIEKKSPRVFSITLTRPQSRPDLELSSLSYVTGGTTKGFVKRPDGATLELTVDESRNSAMLGLQVGCGPPPTGTLGVRVDLVEGGEATVALSDN